MSGVAIRVPRQLRRQFIEQVDRRSGADRHAGSAVDAFRWVDEKALHALEIRLVLLRVDTVNRTSVDAKGVLGAALSDNVCHRSDITAIAVPRCKWQRNQSDAEEFRASAGETTQWWTIIPGLPLRLVRNFAQFGPP